LSIDYTEVAHGGKPYVPGLLSIDYTEVAHGGKPYVPGLLSITDNFIA